MYFLMVEKCETNIHNDLEQPFYWLTRTWVYGGSVFGTKAAGGAEIE